MAMTTAQQTDAYRFFSIAFDAAPGVTYMNQLADAYAAGMTTKEIVNVFTTKDQFNSKYPKFLSNEAFASSLVANVVGTSATDAAKAEAAADVAAALNAGWSRGDVIYQVFTNLAGKAADDATWGNTAKLMANKVAVAKYVTETALTTTTDLAVLSKALSGVTATTDVSTPAALAAAASAVTLGSTYTLTTGADVVNGTAGNDSINALSIKADGTAATTLSDFDVIDGGAGRDTLNIYTTGANNNAFPAMASVKNVEIVNIFNAAAAAALGDASKFVGVTELWQHGSAAPVTNLAATTTAGFKDVAAAVSVTPADTAASAAVALDKLTDAGSVTFGATRTGILNAVTVSGTVVDGVDAGTTVDAIAVGVTVGKDVESLSVNTAVKSGLTVSDGAGTKKVSTVDASASTGDINYTSANTVANVKTGAGNDAVTLATSLNATVKAASISTGAGNDTVTVSAVVGTAATGQTVTVDAGEGNDTVNVTLASGVTYDVKGGAGNDTVTVTNTIKSTDKIDGGDGSDTITLAGKATYVADDYIVFNKVLTNFETLKLTTAGSLDLSQLAANYTTVDLATGSTALKVGTQALVANGGLTATATGTDTTKAPKVYAGTLNITEKASGTITANADTVNLSVDASKGAVAAVLEGFAKTANVTLVQALKADKSAFEGAATFSLTTAAGVDADLASLTLSGNGAAAVMNAAGTSLVTVNASALNSLTFDGKIADGLTYATSNAKAESITLGGGIDKVTVAAGSTYGVADTITGLNLVLNDGKTALAAASDTFKVTGATGAVKFTTTQTDLDLALKDAAALAGENVAVFQMGGNTYVYKDVAAGGSDLVDSGDILVKLTGTIDLDALVIALG